MKLQPPNTTPAGGFPDTVSARCSCGRKLPPAPAMRHATIQVRRTCRGCRRRWSLILRPRLADIHGRRVLITAVDGREVAP